jgi:hypothetical protein
MPRTDRHRPAALSGVAVLALLTLVLAWPAAGQTPAGATAAPPGSPSIPTPPAVQQSAGADPDFHPTVERPAFTGEHPLLMIDEAHLNHHTADGRYKPFADLATRDGFAVVPGTGKLDRTALERVRILVVANADGDPEGSPAFSEAECEAVFQWVQGGGALLLIADHAPFGSAAQPLARRFGVEMGNGFVNDPEHSPPGQTRFLNFSRDSGLLGDHPITRGRDERERVSTVMTFAGQSLSIPPGATSLLTLGATAVEGPDRDFPSPKNLPVAGRSQGLALTAGKGRVVILGEAGMFSAQVLTTREEGKPPSLFRFGMNVPGTDDVQFALNVLRWLAGALG